MMLTLYCSAKIWEYSLFSPIQIRVTAATFKAKSSKLKSKSIKKIAVNYAVVYICFLCEI